MKTFFMIKPDGVKRNLIGEVISRVEGKGFKITKIKMMTISQDLAKEHYGEHKDKPFFSSLVSFITSSPVIAIALKGENAIQKTRTMMGATNPLESEPGTIRGDFGLTVEKNIIHGSANEKDAKRELGLYFNNDELLDYSRSIDEWTE